MVHHLESRVAGAASCFPWAVEHRIAIARINPGSVLRAYASYDSDRAAVARQTAPWAGVDNLDAVGSALLERRSDPVEAAPARRLPLAVRPLPTSPIFQVAREVCVGGAERSNVLPRREVQGALATVDSAEDSLGRFVVGWRGSSAALTADCSLHRAERDLVESGWDPPHDDIRP